jgi:hypothetical protein
MGRVRAAVSRSSSHVHVHRFIIRLNKLRHPLFFSRMKVSIVEVEREKKKSYREVNTRTLLSPSFLQLERHSKMSPSQI